MTDVTDMYDYPGRAGLIGGMGPLLKAARRPLAPEWDRSGLDRDGWHHLDLLAHRLARHVYFEHQGREKIRDALHEAVLRHRAMTPSARPGGREFAAETLDAMVGQSPLLWWKRIQVRTDLSLRHLRPSN